MYLIISDLKKYFPSQGKILPLHSFIKYKINKNNLINSDTDFNSIKPFKTPKEYKDAYRNILNTVDEIIPDLANKLNHIHNKDHDQRYWRTFLGIWLINFISMVHDRYYRLKNVSKNINSPIIFESDKSFSDFHIINGIHFYEIAASDKEFNQFIYSFLAKKVGIKVVKKINSESFEEEDENYKPSTDVNFPNRLTKKKYYLFNLYRITKIIYLLLKKIEEKIFSNNSKVILYLSYLPSKFSFFLSIFSFYKIYELKTRRMTSINEKGSIINDESRKFLSEINQENDELKKIIYEMMRFCIPKSFIEDYTSIIDYSNDAYRNLSPDYIYSPNAWFYDYAFIHWSLMCRRRGAKIISGTHANGGPPCLERYKIFTDFEKSIGDYYIDTGQYYFNNLKIKNVTSGILLQSANKKRKRKNRIVYVGTLDPIFPVGSLEDFDNFIQNTISFLNYLPKEIFNQILFRSHYEDFNWGLNNILIKEFPLIKFSLWNKKFHDVILNSKLCVFGYISTSCHEAIALNIPSIIILDKQQYSFTKETEDDFNNLKKVGIIHENPKSAADWLKLYHSEIDEWWYSPECQDTISKFNYKYMNINKNPYKEWKRVFLGIK